MESQSHKVTSLLTEHQQRLYRYIVSLLGNVDAAWDVLQETNRVVLEKRSEFQFGTSFTNWALTIAQFQTLAWLRSRKRDRLVVTAEIVELLAEDARGFDQTYDARQTALDTCLESLSDEHRELVHRRYNRSETLPQLSQRTGRTVNALKQMFFRLRNSLMNCIQQRLELE